MSFSRCKTSLFIISHITMDRLRKTLLLFNWVPKLFFSDLVLIENQLILISYEKLGLKEERLK
jgi:hypothetical protein